MYVCVGVCIGVYVCVGVCICMYVCVGVGVCVYVYVHVCYVSRHSFLCPLSFHRFSVQLTILRYVYTIIAFQADYVLGLNRIAPVALRSVFTSSIGRRTQQLGS